MQWERRKRHSMIEMTYTAEAIAEGCVVLVRSEGSEGDDKRVISVQFVLSCFTIGALLSVWGLRIALVADRASRIIVFTNFYFIYHH